MKQRFEWIMGIVKLVVGAVFMVMALIAITHWQNSGYSSTLFFQKAVINLLFTLIMLS